jgi:hypothetical protein
MVSNLKWLLIFVAGIVVLAVCAMLGLVEQMWQADKSKISFIALALYFPISGFIGWLTWQSSAGRDAPRRKYREACAYGTNLMTQLGLLGNSAGLLFLCGVLAKVDASNAASMQAAVPQLSSGLAIAAANTFVGLLCAALLSLQVVNLNLAPGK